MIRCIGNCKCSDRSFSSPSFCDKSWKQKITCYVNVNKYRWIDRLKCDLNSIFFRTKKSRLSTRKQIEEVEDKMMEQKCQQRQRRTTNSHHQYWSVSIKNGLFDILVGQSKAKKKKNQLQQQQIDGQRKSRISSTHA